MRKMRYQKGSLRVQRSSWVVQYRDASGSHRQRTLGPTSELTRTEAETERANFMIRMNAKNGIAKPMRMSRVTLGEFVHGKYFPFKEGRWKDSTKLTTKDRMERHLVDEIGDRLLVDLDREVLQELINRKAAVGLSKSMADHLRFDLGGIFKMAMGDGLVDRNPAVSLYTPRKAERAERRVMTLGQVLIGFSALAQRERLIFKLAVLTSLRPGEIFALLRKHVNSDHVEIAQRVYQGLIDTPKSTRSTRKAAVPAVLGAELREWLSLIDSNPEAWLFPSEKGSTPLRPENVWRRAIGPQLKAVGLDWVNFQVLRRTHETLSHAQGIDPKTRADQAGHNVGVAINEYTATSLDQRLAAVQTLEPGFPI